MLERRRVDARDRLQRKIRGGPNARALATAIGERFGYRADLARQIRHALANPSAAEGPMLDLVGALVSLPRAGDSDDRYRLALRVWSRCRGSTCSTDEVLGIVREWIGAGPTVALDPSYPLGFTLEISDLDDADLARLIVFVGKAKGATYHAAIVVVSDTSGLLCDTVAEDVDDARTCDTVAEDVDDAGTCAVIFDV